MKQTKDNVRINKSDEQQKRWAQSLLIRKLRHGRLSMTKDGAIQLTLKIPGDECTDIPTTLLAEAYEAKLALALWLKEGGHFIGGENQENVAC